MNDWLVAEYSEDPSIKPTFPEWPSFVSLIDNKMLHLQHPEATEIKARIQSFDIASVSTQAVIESMGVTQIPVSLFDDRGEDVVRVMDCNLVSENSSERSRKLDLRLKSINLAALPKLHSDDLAEINSFYFLMAKSFEFVLSRLIDAFGGIYRDDETVTASAVLDIRPLAALFNDHNVTISVVSNGDDELLDDVKEMVIAEKRCSVSQIQRKFKIGYNRAARLVEQLEGMGIVSQPDNGGQRCVFDEEAQ
ncbi:hypothetical protein CTM83_20210 [Photobacterium leiognathi subsp. mandapamensis]|nr:hypothetical protein CTM83_20210 [Photobacterium leiognathi subsp. mandapamensis]